MSHIASVKTKVKDLQALEAVCRELNIRAEVKTQQVSMYSGEIQAAATLRLPGWTYPVVIQADGSVKYDNYNGRWGKQDQLNRVLRRYSERITAQQARRMGLSVRRHEQPDGSVVLRLRA
jgi:hypothetical protein